MIALTFSLLLLLSWSPSRCQAAVDPTFSVSEFLHELGFLEYKMSPTDDDYDERVEEAVYWFQEFFGLPRTGREDDATLEFMSKTRGEDGDEAASLRVMWDHQHITWSIRDNNMSPEEVKAISEGIELWNQVDIFQFVRVGMNQNPDILAEFSNSMQNWDIAKGERLPNNRFVLRFNEQRKHDWIPSSRTGRLYMRKYAAYMVGILLGLPGNDPDPNSVMSRRMFDDSKPVTERERSYIRQLYPQFNTLDTVRRPFIDPFDENGPMSTASPTYPRFPPPPPNFPRFPPPPPNFPRFPQSPPAIPNFPRYPPPPPPPVPPTYPRYPQQPYPGSSNQEPKLIPLILSRSLFIFKGDVFWRHTYTNVPMKAYSTSVLFDFRSNLVNLKQLHLVYQRKDYKIGLLIGNQHFLFDRNVIMPGYPKTVNGFDPNQVLDARYSKDAIFITTSARKIVKVRETESIVDSIIDLQ